MRVRLILLGLDILTSMVTNGTSLIVVVINDLGIFR